jgi:hypothetical protein
MNYPNERRDFSLGVFLAVIFVLGVIARACA